MLFYVKTVNTDGSVQLELFNDFYVNNELGKESSELRKSIDRFYIVTYAIDESRLISKISLFMPNPKDNKAYLIDDLTKYIKPYHQPVIDDELISALSTTVEADEHLGAHWFDIGIVDDEEEKSDS